MYYPFRKKENVHIEKGGIIMSTEAQKKAYRTYNEKKKTFSAVYTPTDMIEGLRFEQFLKTQPLSKNEYLKKLIKQDMDSKSIPYPNETNTD